MARCYLKICSDCGLFDPFLSMSVYISHFVTDKYYKRRFSLDGYLELHCTDNMSDLG
jgi:hypothetical protein